MPRSLLQRIGIDLLLCISIFILPWWLTCAVVVCMAVYFDLYYEIVLFGFIVDSVYGVPSSSLSTHYHATLYAVIILAAIVLVKKIIKEFIR